MTDEEMTGGFALSPPPSSVASSAAVSSLPHPRAAPLRAGGSKESAFIRFADTRIAHIRRRFAKRTTPASELLSDVDRDKADSWHDVKGYTSMSEACKDMEELVKVIWVSGTPSLQVPNLINLAMLLTNIIDGMPPTPKSLFRLLAKFDHAFASLIQGRDVETGEVLPGFERRAGINDTEKVRIRSIIERTRVNIVETFKKGEFQYEEVDGEDTDMDDDDGLVLENPDEDDATDDQPDSWDMQLSRVYEKTLEELGETLSNYIGLATEPTT